MTVKKEGGNKLWKCGRKVRKERRRGAIDTILVLLCHHFLCLDQRVLNLLVQQRFSLVHVGESLAHFADLVSSGRCLLCLSEKT